MQTREQIKNWKVVASVATVAALGVSGLAIASPGDAADTPPPIEIQDQRSGDIFTPTTVGAFEVVPGPSFRLGGDSFDSPLASANLDSPVAGDSAIDSLTSDDSPAPTAPAVDSADSVDSPAPAAPAPAPADDSADSVDSPAPAPAPADDSADSGDSLDS